MLSTHFACEQVGRIYLCNRVQGAVLYSQLKGLAKPLGGFKCYFIKLFKKRWLLTHSVVAIFYFNKIEYY